MRPQPAPPPQKENQMGCLRGHDDGVWVVRAVPFLQGPNTPQQKTIVIPAKAGIQESQEQALIQMTESATRQVLARR